MPTRKQGTPFEPKQAVHVIPHYDVWATQREGGVRVGRVADTQADAIELGKRMAKRDKVDLVVFGRDGQVQERFSFGKEPPTAAAALEPQ